MAVALDSAPRTTSTPRCWLVGDFNASKVGNHSVAEDLAARLAELGFWAGTTSSRTHRLSRVVDMATATWRMRRSIDVAIVDVFSGRAFGWAELVTAILRQANVPTVLVLRGGNLPRVLNRYPARVRRLLGSADAVVALSDYAEKWARPLSRRLHVIPNPIDITRYPFRARSVVRPRMVWLRTFAETYNPSLAVRVLERVVQRVDDASLIMVGADQGDGSLQRAMALAQECAVADRVEFVGSVPKSAVPAQLERGDILLNTPRIDNVPISVVEAMACGLCVVSTDVGGLPYLLQHESNALLVSDDDAEGMATAVLRCCTDAELSSQLSNSARQTARTHAWEQVLPLWADLLRSVAEGPNK